MAVPSPSRRHPSLFAICFVDCTLWPCTHPNIFPNCCCLRFLSRASAFFTCASSFAISLLSPWRSSAFCRSAYAAPNSPCLVYAVARRNRALGWCSSSYNTTVQSWITFSHFSNLRLHCARFNRQTLSRSRTAAFKSSGIRPFSKARASPYLAVASSNCWLPKQLLPSCLSFCASSASALLISFCSAACNACCARACSIGSIALLGGFVRRSW
mmetsp:Transcript_28258/g.48001  ORF Transcript_28258/g.48001 Transcript_28258/m.48001 type:complete len:213 (+) Transcript_28258:1418-2056(+)